MSTIKAYVLQNQEKNPSCSQLFDCILSICSYSKADKACEALENKTIKYLADMHFLSHKEATTKARRLSQFLFNHLIEANDQRQPLLLEQELQLLSSTQPIDLFDAISRAPYGDGNNLVYPERLHLETLIFRTRENLEAALPVYDANPIAPTLERRTRTKFKLDTNEKMQSNLQKCRDIVQKTALFTEYPGCSYQIKKSGADHNLNQSELYEIWQELQEAYQYVTRLTRKSAQLKTESASQS